MSRVDALLVDAPVIIESDGRRWHTRVADFERDRQRDRAAASHGYVTMRFTYDELRCDPDRVALRSAPPLAPPRELRGGTCVPFRYTGAAAGGGDLAEVAGWGMDYTEIAYQVEDQVATITLDRPDRLNAFTVTMMRELIDAFDQVDADDDVRAVIVTGRGEPSARARTLPAAATPSTRMPPPAHAPSATPCPATPGVGSPCASSSAPSR